MTARKRELSARIDVRDVDNLSLSIDGTVTEEDVCSCCRGPLLQCCIDRLRILADDQVLQGRVSVILTSDLRDENPRDQVCRVRLDEEVTRKKFPDRETHRYTVIRLSGNAVAIAEMFQSTGLPPRSGPGVCQETWCIIRRT